MEYGTVSVCPKCDKKHFSWQSCGNRNCPKCGHEKITQWLAKRQAEILPVDYFMATFTLPSELRKLCRREPAKVYGALLSAAAEALKTLAMDRRFLGGKIGTMGVLHRLFSSAWPFFDTGRRTVSGRQILAVSQKT